MSAVGTCKGRQSWTWLSVVSFLLPLAVVLTQRLVWLYHRISLIGISHSHIGLGVSTEEFRFIDHKLWCLWSQPRCSLPGMQWLMAMCWGVTKRLKNVCMYTCFVLHACNESFLSGNALHDLNRVHDSSTTAITYVLENHKNNIWFVARCCIKAGIILNPLTPMLHHWQHARHHNCIRLKYSEIKPKESNTQ